MAFGTGHHQTTFLIVRSMLQSEKDIRDKQVLDMGCGTGILSILAAKMKAAVPVHAIDIDPVAVRSARENAGRNRVGDRIKSLCGDASLIQAYYQRLLCGRLRYGRSGGRTPGVGAHLLGEHGPLGNRNIQENLILSSH